MPLTGIGWQSIPNWPKTSAWPKAVHRSRSDGPCQGNGAAVVPRCWCGSHVGIHLRRPFDEQGRFHGTSKKTLHLSLFRHSPNHLCFNRITMTLQKLTFYWAKADLSHCVSWPFALWKLIFRSDNFEIILQLSWLSYSELTKWLKVHKNLQSDDLKSVIRPNVHYQMITVWLPAWFHLHSLEISLRLSINLPTLWLIWLWLASLMAQNKKAEPRWEFSLTQN